MSLWSLLGGEVNHERIRKQKERDRRKNIEFQNERLRMKYKSWKKSTRPLKERIEVALEVWGQKEFKEFLGRYPKLIPDDLNPFLNKKEAKKEIEKPKDEIEELKKLVEYQAQLIKKLEQQNKQ